MSRTLWCLFSIAAAVWGQGTAPTFQHALGQKSYTVFGNDPAQGRSTTVPTVIVPVTLVFAAGRESFPADTRAIVQSPVFTPFAFPTGGKTQYVDAMLRTAFPQNAGWHTLLGMPSIKPVRITVPLGNGYVLRSHKTGRVMGIADLDFVHKELFKQIPKQEGKLVMAVTRNIAYYAEGDATICCSWGTHGVDAPTGNSFVLASYLESAPGIVQEADVQPLTQQLAEFANDPLQTNVFSSWMRLNACGGTGAGSRYFLLEPTDTNPKNNFPASNGFIAGNYHLQNAALLAWYTGASGPLSFPDAHALTEPAKPCPPRMRNGSESPTVAAAPRVGRSNGHQLIGYWAGYGGPGSTFPLHEISPQWDVVIVAFATPDKNAPEGTMRFRTPAGLDDAQFKSGIAGLKREGRKVMISLGGGGQHFTLADGRRVPNFVESVSRTVSEYGFDGIDIDFESPSLAIDPGDTDFRHPTTPSIVNLISALRELHDRFGSGFMISLVPEGTQIPAGYPSYGGQFGSYLPIVYALRDILSFIDVQDYNTPPLEGLDGEIYQAGAVDYHAAMTELLLHGFNVGGDPKQFFEPLPAEKVAVGFLTGDTTPEVVRKAMDYLITGTAPPGTRYFLRAPGGYPGLLGAMFWTIDADRRENYRFSNIIGPQLHSIRAGHIQSPR